MSSVHRSIRTRLTYLLGAAAGLCLLVLGLGVNAPTPAPAELVSQIEQIVGDPQFESGFWGVAVQNLQTGELVYDRNAGKNLMPASNMKLFTTATALDALGSGFRYKTTLYFTGRVNDQGLLQGDLVLRGSGDPTFGSQLSGQDPLRAWADSLARMGVRLVRGRIIGDDNVFDDSPYPVGWDIDLVQTESYAAPSSGLAYADNLIDVYLEGSKDGAPVIRAEPSTFIKVKSTAETAGGRGRYSYLRLRRDIGTNQITVDGRVPANYRGRVRLPVTDATGFTVHSFAAHLRNAGIQVEAQLLDVDDVERMPAYDAAMPLMTYVSPPLAHIAAIINKKSENFYAEQVFRTFAWGGSAEGGEKRVKAFLAEAGVQADGLAIADGSGLSRKNMVTAGALAKLLAYMLQHPEREAFNASLAGGGEAGTTLRYRLGGLGLRGKTGSLDYVRALSGYITASDGTPLSFAILANNYSAHSVRIADAQNRFVQALAAADL